MSLFLRVLRFHVCFYSYAQLRAIISLYSKIIIFPLFLWNMLLLRSITFLRVSDILYSMIPLVFLVSLFKYPIFLNAFCCTYECIYSKFSIAGYTPRIVTWVLWKLLYLITISFKFLNMCARKKIHVLISKTFLIDKIK